MSQVLPAALVASEAPVEGASPAVAAAPEPVVDAQPVWNGELESLDRAPWFGFVPEEHRSVVREGLSRVRNGMTADYTAKTQALAAERAQNDQVLQEITARKEALQALLMGEDDPAAVLEAENAKSKAELVALRAQIDELKAQPTGSVTPEEVAQLRSELQEAVAWRQEVEQAAQAASQAALMTEVKAASGDLAEDTEFLEAVIDILATGRLDVFEDAVPRAAKAARALLNRPETAAVVVEPDPLPAAIATQSVTSGGKLGSSAPGKGLTYAELMKRDEEQVTGAWR